VLLVVVLNIPYLERAFGTVALSPRDWLIAALPALTISPVLELAKAAERRGWFGPID
jgi:Ca2+-transporting ATPase